ncbi:MAG: chemotaxis protein CheA, partial [Syntrophales bacterium]|nr:chemotaxis protein CheA [Syntrophales bacterium]
MERDRIETLIDNMAAGILMFDGDSIDIPSAGKLLNAMEEVIREARNRGMTELLNIAMELSRLLESIVLERVDVKTGSALFGDGITTMQEMILDFKESRSSAASTDSFMTRLSEVSGAPSGSAAVAAEEKPGKDNEAELHETSQPQHPVGSLEEDFVVQDESLMRDFITEGLEYIGEIEVNILNLEQNLQDLECINAVFRPFHSIKGVASFLDLRDIRDISHELETLLDRVRSGELSVNSKLIDIILEGADILKEMIGSLTEVLDGTRRKPLVPDLSRLREAISTFDEDDDVHVPDQQGPVKKLGAILVEDGVISEEALEEALKQRASEKEKIGETLIASGKAKPKHVLDALRKQSRQTAETNTIRVDVKKLDDFVDMIGELVITHAMIKQNITNQKAADRKLMADLAQLSSITSELQRTSTSLRMVPIRQTFQRMARLVRDLAKSVGKDVAVVMEGEDTEIDRNMVEEIYNPLVHMVRNSVDHGLETTEERVAAGKDKRGTVRLSAYHKGGDVVIEISDDGRGLSTDKILRKARERGIVRESDELSEQDIYRLLFMAGFSTAEKITDVSGRGVGMDVVKQAVEKLRGKIEIRSVEGEGTTFAAFFPLTMAIIDGMIVKVGNEKYIIPATAIQRLLRPEREHYTNVVGGGEMLNVMGKLMPLIRLYDIFSVEPAYREPWESLVVVVDADNRSKCLLVDEVVEKGEVVIKSLGGNF